MDKLTELMHRLFEIQSSEPQRSPELIEEDDRLIENLRNKWLSERATSTGTS
jgi:hypothetical protein